MGFLDDAKKKATGLLKGRGKQVEGAIDKAAGVVDDKTGGEHTEKIDSAAEKAKDIVGKLDTES